MQTRRSFQLMSCVAAVVLLLLSMRLVAPPCDDDACSPGEPTCDCICSCCGVLMVLPDCATPPTVDNVGYTPAFEQPLYALFLAPEIFRPPIAA